MDARLSLFAHRDPFDLAGTEVQFVRAMRENALFHMEHCPEYREISEYLGFSPDAVRELPDLVRIPVLPTALFKTHRLCSMPERRMAIRATSHGTRGARSRIGLDYGSLLPGFFMVLRMAKLRGLLSLQPAHYILLGYQPHRGNEMAVTKTAYGSTFFAPAKSRTYALRYQDGKYVADLEGILNRLQMVAAQKSPVRLMGFPSYTYFMLQMLAERGIRMQLPKGSRILLGGGWKQFYRERVDKTQLYALAATCLGIGEGEITECFGAAEHPILYTDCPCHHFHIPVYSRVLIRDVQTLAPLPMGKTGLVNLLTPLVKAVPLTSVMTDDLGVLHPGTECPCGCQSPFLELIGRVGMREIKTCAAGAAELLKGDAQ